MFCGVGQVKRQLEYLILDYAQNEWDAIVAVNGETTRAMTAYNYFGNAKPPWGFVVVLLGEHLSEFLAFTDGNRNWIQCAGYQYTCAIDGLVCWDDGLGIARASFFVSLAFMRPTHSTAK